jgi:hypothetical protein
VGPAQLMFGRHNRPLVNFRVRTLDKFSHT